MSPRLQTLLALALPIIAGMVSQNVFNLVDTYMVGHLGASALAAVGLTNYLNFASVAFITGLSAGVQAMTAWRKGGDQMESAALPLNGGLVLCLVLGIPLSALLFFIAPTLIGVLNDDPAIVTEAVPYFEARIFGMVALGINFSFRGFWNGIGSAKVYMNTLITMNVANILFNYVLIFGNWGFPELGTLGAGIGSTLAAWVGVGVYWYQANRRARSMGFLRSCPDRAELGQLWRLSMPVSVQQLLFASGLTVFFWVIGRIGAEELAIANVMMNLALVLILPCMGFGMAAATLVGQALGAGDARAARAWGWYSVRYGTLVICTLALPLLIWPDVFLSAFLHDPALVEKGIAPMRIMAFAMSFDAVAIILSNALLGAGKTRLAAIVGVFIQWAIHLPSVYVIAIVLGGGLTEVWIGFIAYRVLGTVVFAVLWERTKLEVPARAGAMA